MAEVFLQHPSAPGMAIPNCHDTSERSSFVVGEAGSNTCLPNEPFAFPVQEPFVPPSVSHQRRPSRVGNASSRPISHRPKPSNLSLSTLPPFDFGFSPHDTSTKPVPSPTRSPARLTPPIGYSSGHRRGGSEFIGGGIINGGPVLVSTNSADGENPQASNAVNGPPAGRRGHSHRRSHAVSQSDVSAIMQPMKQAQAGSAPATPSESRPEQRSPSPTRSNSHPGQTSSHAESGSGVPASRDSSYQTSTLIRVGDNPDFIPKRPLSIISSETSSSQSTARAVHSVSASVSSLVSGREPSPPAVKSSSIAGVSGTSERQYVFPSQACRTTTRTPNKNPNTALDDGLPVEVPSSAQGIYHQATHTPSESFTQEFNTRSRNAHDRSLQSPESKRSWDKQSAFARLQHRSQPDVTSPHLRPKTSPEDKTSRRQQSVKPWAEEIIHCEERQLSDPVGPAVEPSTDDLYDSILDAGFSLDDINLDDDTTTIIEEPMRYKRDPVYTHHDSDPQTLHTSALTPENAQQSPMIDLDAALGHPDVENYDQSSDYCIKALASKRKLHSSGETGGFIGPGMHYHRRAESAPELEPFERARYGFPRLGSNPALEDAIAEEDEDSNPESKRGESQGLGLGVKIVDSEPITKAPMRRQSGRTARSEERRVIHRLNTPPNPFPLIDPVEIVDAEDEPRVSTITKSSDDSSITPTVSPEPLTHRPMSAPLESALQTPSLTYGTTPETPSAVSSADYKKTSFDVREARIHTARSSMTDRMTLNSSRAGDLSAGSVDDVPSLTSSSSTMMSSFATRFSGSGQMSGPTERSASLSAAVPFKSRPGSSKRASLASLSKLMGGPHNKSRLNIAESVTPDNPEKQEKKRHRISRMMRFWKSKDRLSPE